MSNLPEHMKQAARMWVERAEPHPRMLGSFMRAVLTNNLVDAFAHADRENREAMYEWAKWLYNDIPSPAWGSSEKLDAWYAAHHEVAADGA